MAITRLVTLDAETADVSSVDSSDYFSIVAVPRTGSYAYRVSGTEDGFRKVTTTTHVRIQYFLNFNLVPTQTPDIYRPVVAGLYDDGINNPIVHGVVFNGGNYTLELYVNGVLVDTVSVTPYGFINVNRWTSVTLIAKSGVGDGYVRFYLDGDLILSASGTVTSFTGVGVANQQAGFLNGSFPGAYIDDVYIDDVAGETVVFPIDRRFLKKIPNGVGADAQFTPSPVVPNWQNVDEGVPDDDTTYNGTQTLGLKDTFSFTNTSSLVSYIPETVFVQSSAKKLDTGIDTQIKLHVYDGVTYQESVSLGFVGINYDTVVAEFPLDNSGSPWSLSLINSAQYGYVSSGTF